MSQVILYGRFSTDPLWPDLGDPQGSCITTFWISVLGAALVVVHDIISKLIWFVLTALWIRSNQGSDGNAK
jgi:hypothetical protein